MASNLLESLCETSFEVASSGLANGWVNAGNTVPQPTFTLSASSKYGAYAQRVQVVGTANARTLRVESPKTGVGTFAAGESATGQIEIFGAWLGLTSALLTLRAIDAAGAVLGAATANLVQGVSYSRATVTYTSLPAGTSQCRLDIGNFSGVDIGDSIDFTVDGAKLAKESTASPFIEFQALRTFCLMGD